MQKSVLFAVFIRCYSNVSCEILYSIDVHVDADVLANVFCEGCLNVPLCRLLFDI